VERSVAPAASETKAARSTAARPKKEEKPSGAEAASTSPPAAAKAEKVVPPPEVAPPADVRPPATDHRPPATDNRQHPTSDKLGHFLQTAGERRVEQAREVEGPSGTLLELLTFSIAGELYAVSIDNVVEIVTPRAVTRIPNSDPSIVGILSLRGMIVTLIDAHRRLGHRQAAEPDPETRIIVVQLDHETLGFTVDKVLRVVKIDAEAVQPHPVVHASEQDVSVRGVFRHADALTILLDLDKLLNTRAAAAPAS
jgi:purine-binding chemotaxis protein CheW